MSLLKPIKPSVLVQSTTDQLRALDVTLSSGGVPSAGMTPILEDPEAKHSAITVSKHVPGHVRRSSRPIVGLTSSLAADELSVLASQRSLADNTGLLSEERPPSFIPLDLPAVPRLSPEPDQQLAPSSPSSPVHNAGIEHGSSNVTHRDPPVTTAVIAAADAAGVPSSIAGSEPSSTHRILTPRAVAQKRAADSGSASKGSGGNQPSAGTAFATITGDAPGTSGVQPSIAPAGADGARRPSWVPDDQVSACVLCDRDFGLFRRRHHCRRW